MEQTLVNGIADNLLHNIFNDLSVGLELYDKDGLMIDVNYSRLRSMGIKDKKDILGYNLFNYTSFSDEIKEQIRKGETVRFMAKYDFDDLCRLFPTNLSGIKFFEITVSFVHNDKSEITNYMVITQDITERVLWQNKYDNLYEEVVRSKKELLESEQRMIHLIRQNELVLNNINSGLAYIANDYIVQWENISLCSKSLSYEAYKKGEPCYLTAHNRTTPCENCVMQRARKSGQVESILFNLDNKHVIEVFATPIFNEQGDVDGVVIRVDDVTERQHMIGELEKARSRAEQSDKLKSAFLANMSHEIRTPLNAIVGFSNLLPSAETLEEEKLYSSIINQNSEILLQLINDILDLSKIEAGTLEYVRQPMNLGEICRNIYQIHKDRVQEGVTLILDNQDEDLIIEEDRNRIAQVITNFLTNAGKFTLSGEIRFGFKVNNQCIRFYVKDTGIGIAPDKVGHIFDRFVKLNSFAQGTGLGLAICRMIIEKIGGEIGVTSEIGKGSTFYFTIPYKESSDDRIAFSEASETKYISHTIKRMQKIKKILVAEDVDSNFVLIKNMIGKDYTLLWAKDGFEAVEMYKQFQPDLILMDIKMPRMGGLEATRIIRSYSKEIPVIALTAYAFEADKEQALEAGCNDFVTKPVSKAALAEAVGKCCG